MLRLRKNGRAKRNILFKYARWSIVVFGPRLNALVETSRVRLKYLGQGFLALVFMIGTLAGMAGGFLALLAFRLAGGVD